MRLRISSYAVQKSTPGCFWIVSSSEERYDLIPSGRREQWGNKIERSFRTFKGESRRHHRHSMKLERIIAIIACNEDYYNNEWPHPELHGLMPHENFHAKSIADELAGVSATYLGCT